MYRNSFQPNVHANNLKQRFGVVLVLCILFFIATVVLAFTMGSNAAFRTNTNNKLLQRTRNAISTAISEAEKIDGSITSYTSAQLSRVRQSVYLAEQLSAISVELSGEGARLIPLDFFSSNSDIYDTLDAFNQRMEGVTSNTNDLKRDLLIRLENVQLYLSGK